MPLISETLAQSVHQLRYEGIPAQVRERAKDLMLDAIGIAHASTKFEFADKALAGLSFFGSGSRAVIGMCARPYCAPAQRKTAPGKPGAGNATYKGRGGGRLRN